MAAKYKFRIGQRVRPSAQGIASFIFPKTRYDQSGIVKKVDKFNCPSILWDGRRVIKTYHYNFVVPDRRKTRNSTRG